MKDYKKILEILKRIKYHDSYSGEYPYDKEEYARMINEEVIKPLKTRRVVVKDNKKIKLIYDWCWKVKDWLK